MNQENICKAVQTLLVDKINTYETNKIKIGVSNHHVHLSRTDLDTLFGKDYALTKKGDLGQPGQFAARETVTLKGPKAAFKNIRILGPVRKESQVEISKSDSFRLGIKAPITLSGHLVVSRKAAADFPLEGSLTVYPVASQDFAVKAALGITDTFETQWFNRCVRSGSRVQLVLSGLTRFTGKEPAAYVQRILSYYRTLLTYDVQIGPWENNNRTVLPSAAVPAVVPAQPSYGAGQVSVSRTIITASDLDTYAEGSTVPLAPGTMVTAYAEDEAEKRHIRFIRIQR